MRYRGRVVDPIALWANYVKFPQNMREDEHFLPLVVCPNPEHQTSKRHFQINTQEPLVHCFAECGISGTYENAIAQIEGVSHRQARRIILKHARIPNTGEKFRTGSVRKRPAYGGTSASTVQPALDISVFDSYLPPVALEYCQARGISATAIAKWGLRWDAEDKRLVIPVLDARGRVRCVIRRGLTERQQPKYLYTEGVDKTRLLFGSGHIDLGMIESQGIVLVEGSIDAIIQHQHGYMNSVAILGSRLSEIQAKLIARMRPKRIYTMFDADGSGIAATFSVVRLLPSIPIFVCRYPKGKTDPAELIREEAVRSIERAISAQQFFKKIGRKMTRSYPKEISVG